MPDNFALWKRWQDSQDAWLERRPVCHDCGEHIQEDHYYLINDEIVCPDCMEDNYKKSIEDYIE